MTRTTDSWDRLAKEMRERRRYLGLTQDEAVAKGGSNMNRTLWQQLEGSRRAVLPAKSEYAICRALGWTEDSVRRIHQNLSPILVEEAEGRELPSTVEVIEADPALDSDARELMLNFYRSLCRQVAERLEAFERIGARVPDGGERHA